MFDYMCKVGIFFLCLSTILWYVRGREGQREGERESRGINSIDNTSNIDIQEFTSGERL